MVVSPEYNHTMPPALTAMMNQIGCSKYANKVSACVTYSGFSSAAGNYCTPASCHTHQPSFFEPATTCDHFVTGGARCAVALRPFLSELGCIPVSKQVIIPDANKVLSEEGEWVGDHKDGAAKTLASSIEQMAFYGDALAIKRAAVAAK
jgi:NAD(P)H-dependent FMN reductase